MERSFRVVNPGPGEVELRAGSPQEWILVRPAMLRLKPGEEGVFRVQVTLLPGDLPERGVVSMEGPGGFRRELEVTGVGEAIEKAPPPEGAGRDVPEGYAHLSAGRFEEALACYERFEAEQGGFMGADPGDYFHYWAERGEVLQGLGRLEEALACYDQAALCDFAADAAPTMLRLTKLRSLAEAALERARGGGATVRIIPSDGLRDPQGD